MSKKLIRILLTIIFILLSITNAAEHTVIAQQTASISGQVFLDNNYNGLLDEGEKPVPGAEITLILANEQTERIVHVTTGNEAGLYHFTGLTAGRYYMSIVLPDNLLLSTPASSSSMWLPSSGSRGRSRTIAVSDGVSVRADFGTGNRKAYINVVAFGDENMNAGRMSSEPLLQHVEASLVYEADGIQYPIASGSTNREGTLQLRDVTPATYRLVVNMPEPYIVGPLGSKLTTFFNTVIPTQGNKGMSEPFDLQRSLGLGVGGVKASTLKGSIWFDHNLNGQKDPGEDGAPGIELVLKHSDMQVERRLITDASAEYHFDYLQAGNYTLQANLPEGVMFALPGSPSIFQDGFSNHQSMNIQILDGVPAQADAIGVMPSSGVLVTAFHDSNLNGQQDKGEPLFAGAVVNALQNGEVMSTVTTDSDGQAFLSRVRSGTAQIQVVLPDGQIFTVAGGENGNAFYQIETSSDVTLSTPLAAGEQVHLKAGVTLPSAISGILFEDTNLSGVQDAGEKGLDGFIIQAIDQNNHVTAQATTGDDGHYFLGNLTPQQYRIRVLLTSPYVFSAYSETGAVIENLISSQTAEYGETDPVSLAAGQELSNISAGAFRSAVLSGSILLGDESSGFDGKIGGLAGVIVRLIDENNQPVSNYTVATSDENGYFSLKGALPGSYRLSYTLPDHSKFSNPITDEKTILSKLIEVKASDELQLQPVFVVKTGIVSGTSFYDINANGIKDDTETGLSAASITLINTKSGENYSVTTDKDGLYHIVGIRPGHYRALAELPEGYVFDFNDKSIVPAALSNQSESELNISMGTVIEQGLLPAVKPVSFTGNVFYDNDLNNLYDAAIDTAYMTSFTLTHQRTSSVFQFTSDDHGFFSNDAIYPGKYILQADLPEAYLLIVPENNTNHGTVWKAELSFSEESSNLSIAVVQLGSVSGNIWNMDSSTKDVQGIPVTLTNKAQEVMQQTTTATDGSFSFDRLMPVEYILSVSLPEAYRFARSIDTAQRVSVITSDLEGQTNNVGETAPFKLNMGEDKHSQDIGIGAMGKLGDYVWLDIDKDGMQDAGEPGIPGIQITLYQYGQQVAQTQSDAYGRFVIENLFPGTYLLEAQMPEELQITIQQKEFPLVGSILNKADGSLAIAEEVIVPSGGRNLNADLGFILKNKDRYPANLQQTPKIDWTRVNEHKPLR